MARFVMEFESAAEMAAVQQVLEGRAEVEIPRVAVANLLGSSISLVVKASTEAEGGLLVEVHQRTNPEGIMVPPGNAQQIT